MIKTKTNESGQVLIALVLTLLTILTIGLIVIQRSTTDISTSTQNDQASRAFSAAEAGIEQALQAGSAPSTGQQTSLSNDASYVVSQSAKLPLPRQAFEYFPTSRGEVSQVWLANPADPTLPEYYKRDNVYVYFGNPNSTGAEAPAIEINLLTRKTTGEYFSYRWYYDTNSSRIASNGFVLCGSDGISTMNFGKINTSLSTNGTTNTDREFKCRVQIPTYYTTSTPILVRARVLYSDNQQFAVAPIPNGTSGDDLPPQSVIFTSIGLSGQSRKTIQVLKVDGVVPFFFDYAVFSAADIIKTN